MIYLNTALSQHFAVDELPAAVRSVLGKPLRRAATLTQLAVLGSDACLPAAWRDQPTALLWQSTSGPRPETERLLAEMRDGPGEPMPYDFLATQPAIAAAQLQPLLPGLGMASHLPLDSAGPAQWSLLLTLAINWLHERRFAQVLCAQLDQRDGAAHGQWLALSRRPGSPPLASVEPAEGRESGLADTPDLPEQLNRWLGQMHPATIALESPAASRLTVKFTRL